MFLKVTGNLLCGSGGGEGARKANDDHVLSLGVLGDVDGLRVREVLEELGGGELVTGGDVKGGRGAGVRHRGRESGGATGQSGGKEELHGCGLGLYPTSSNFGSKVVWLVGVKQVKRQDRQPPGVTQTDGRLTYSFECIPKSSRTPMSVVGRETNLLFKIGACRSSYMYVSRVY